MKLAIDTSLPLVEELFTAAHFDVFPFKHTTACLTTSVDAVVSRAHTRINETFIAQSNPTLIATATSGSDHLDKAYLLTNRIPWIDAKGANAQSVCDYVCSIITHPKVSLPGQKIGIIGVGQVGSKVKQALAALSFDIICYDPIRALAEPGFSQATLHDIAQCDLITLHVPLTTSGPYPTFGMLDSGFLNALNPHTVLINTSRGEVINIDALMQLGTPLQLCFDVFPNEPHCDPALIQKCLIATPHIAGHAIEAKQRAVLMIYKKLFAFYGQVAPSTIHDYLLQKQHFTYKASPYDPFLETALLQQCPSAEQFIKLRKQHNNRHEFCFY